MPLISLELHRLEILLPISILATFALLLLAH